MKKLLIVNNNLHIGGVQKALVNLLREIHGAYDITLLLFYPGGALLRAVPEDIKVVSPGGALRYWGMTREDAATWAERLGRSFWAGVTRLFGRGFAAGLVCPFQKKLGRFDAAISFLHSGPPRVFYGGCNEFVLRCTAAEKKLTFLHCDYEKIGGACRYNEALYRRFDAIAACSGGCADAFSRAMPQLAERVRVVPNCQSYGEIARLAREEEVPVDREKLNLLTVARFGREKGVVRGIRAVAALGERRREVVYRIIGSGAEYPAAVALIRELGLEETVQLLGERENPYGYMAASDVLVIPSVSEAAPMVIGEAACLGTPVLTTRTSSAREMVAEKGWGWVCENSEAGITAGIAQLLDGPEQVAQRRDRLNALEFDNRGAVKEFSELVG